MHGETHIKKSVKVFTKYGWFVYKTVNKWSVKVTNCGYKRAFPSCV